MIRHQPAWFAVVLLAVGATLSADSGSGDLPQADAEVSDETDALTAFRDELRVVARPLASQAATLTLIDRKAIEESNARTVADLLTQVAGVHLLSQGSRGGLAHAQVRGGDPNFSLVLLDGVLLNNPADLEGGAVNLANLSVTHVERVDVARGPHSYFYGSNALSGLINIVTRRATTTPTFRLGLEAGDFSLLRADASGSSRRGGGDAFVGAEWEQEERRLGDDAFEQLGVQGSFGFALGERTDLRLAARAVSRDTADYRDASGGPVFGSGELRLAGNDELSAGANLVLVSTPSWSHRLTGSVLRHEIDRTSPAVAQVVPPSVEDISYSRWRTSWLSTGVASDNVLLNLGVDVEAEQASNTSRLLLPPFLGGEIPGDYALSRTTPGAFVEVAVSHGNLLVEAGLRADLPDSAGTEWSPRVALRYRLPDSGASLKATASRAFKLPSFLALGSPPALGGNPELRPETSTGFDLGVEADFDGGNGRAGLGTFLIRYEDLIEFDFQVFQLLNRSRVEARGVESFVHWRPTTRLRLRANLTWQEVEDLQVSGTPLHQPEWLGNASVVWRPTPVLTLGLDGTVVSESLDTQLTVPDRSSVAGYQLLHLNALWKSRRVWQIRARVENLTDEQYEQFIGFPGPRRSIRVAIGLELSGTEEGG